MTVNAPDDVAAENAAEWPARVFDAVKTYGSGDNAVHALAGVTVGFRRGEFTAIMGPSGSGKSTLLQCAAGLDRLTSGRVFIGDTELGPLDETGRTLVRRDKVGFVFQSFNLIPSLRADENILLPFLLAKQEHDPAWFDLVVGAVGLNDRLGHKPSELSGGQQQRVAVARALVTKPALVFADEPTGNLDSISGAEILAFMRQAVDDLGQTIVMVTHDPRAASYADRALFLADGKIKGELVSPDADGVLSFLRDLEV
jgi:putative ABC transport system ATP-binding protein